MKKPSSRAIARQRRLNAKRAAQAASGRRNFKLQSAIAPAAVLMAGAFGGAQALAATTTLDTGTTYATSVVGATGHLVINDSLVNQSVTIEALSLNVLNQSQISTSPGAGTGTGLSVDVDGNVVAAVAAGNSFENEIDLNLIDSANPNATGVGVGVISYSLNRNTAVSSGVAASGFDQVNENVDDGTFTVSDNLVLSQTSLNLGVNTVQGQVPTGYSDSSPGSIAFAFPTGLGDLDLNTEATITVSSHQLNFDALGRSSASATDNFATLAMDGDSNLPLEATLQVNGNEFASRLQGNVVDSVIPLLAGDNPAFEGTIALTSLQGNVADAGGQGLARTAGTVVSGVVQDHTLDGTLTVSGNAISSFARGNDGRNAIELQDSLSFAGAGATGAPAANIVTGVGPDSVEANLAADLGLLNVQANQSVSIGAETADSTVRALANRLDGASMQVNLNRVSASASGSVGDNRIVGEQANSFEGSAAVASFQANQDPDAGATLAISASIEGTAVDALVGGGVDGVLEDSTVTVVGTGVLADATGNRVANELALAGNTLALGQVGVDPLPGRLTGGQEGISNLDGRAGAQVLNIQAGYSVDTTASIDATSIGIDAGVFAGGTLTADIQGSSLQVADTAVDATAVGNRAAANMLSLNANALTGSAMLGTVQALDGPGNQVSASVDDVEIGVLAGGAGINLIESSVMVGDNLVRGLAFGNRANSSVMITANSATLPEAAGELASVVDFNIAGANQTINAAYGLLGVQSGSQDVSGTVNDVRIGTITGGAATRSQLDVTSNAVVGAAIANEGLNAMALDLNNLAFADPAQTGPVATVTAAQETTGDVTGTVGELGAAPVAPGGAAPIQIGGIISGALTDSTLTVADNIVQSEAIGNLAAANGSRGNTLSVTGTNIAALPAVQLSGISVDGTGIEVDTMFSVVNSQRFTDAAQLTADLGGVLIATVVEGSVDNSTVSLNDNVAAASGTLNQAFNALTMSDITSLSGAAALVSRQQGVASANVNVENVARLAQSGDVTNSTVQLDDNFTQARARGNDANNRVTIDVANLTLPGNVDGGGNALPNTVGYTSQINAAVASANIQSMIGDTGAVISGPTFNLIDAGNIEGSSVSLNDNFASASAQANTATSDMLLSANLISQVEEGPVAAVVNDQLLAGGVTSRIFNTDGDLAVVDVGSIEQSSVSASGNTFLAEGFGNRADNGAGLGNRLRVEGGSVVTPGNYTGLLRIGNANVTADAALVAQNRQIGLVGPITASVGPDGGTGLIRIDSDGAVTDSTVAADANVISATAGMNRASTGIELLDLNAVRTTAFVGNLQVTEGQPVSAEVDSGIDLNVEAGGVENSTLSIADNLFLANATANAGVNRLMVDGNTVSSGTTALSGTPETEWVTLEGGVSPEPGDLTRRTQEGDFLLSSVQFNQALVTATGDTDLNLLTAGGVSGSTLNLRNNIQEARATGSRADSEIMISATNLGTDTIADPGASSSLFASQELAGLGVRSEATLTGQVTGSVSDSSVRADGNQNRAITMGQDLATRTTVQGTNLRSSHQDVENAVIDREVLGLVDQSILLRADHSLVQFQALAPENPAGAEISATASTTLNNHDQAIPGAISDSSADFSRNLTEAIAVGNRARGSLTLDGSTVGTTGAVFNEQLAGVRRDVAITTVEASADSTIRFALDGDAAPVATNSTVDVSGNATLASATVNQASNALQVLAGASYQDVAPGGASATIFGATGTNANRSSDVNATFAVLNRQANVMDVSSTATARHEIDFSDGAVAGTSMIVTGNEVRADANGNFAVNQLSMTSRPGGNGSAVIGNRQQNQGNLSAAVSNSRFGINVGGASSASNSTASVNGNRAVASSTGNTSVNRITSNSGGN